MDFRLLLPRWLEDFAARGGNLICDQLPDDAPSLEGVVGGHDLVVVAVGRTSIASLFPVDPLRSPYAAPQRVLLAALCDGLALPDPLAISFNIAPGAGELFQMPILTADGLGTNLLIEAVPGGPLADVVSRPADDPRFLPEFREALAMHAPAIAARVDGTRFAIHSPRDVLQGAITPAVRHPFTLLADGTPALAIGDAWITNDPITGQGANIGSHSAFVAANAIATGGPFDDRWADEVEEAMWAFAGPVTAWTNAFLQPPPPHAVGLLQQAAECQAVADAFVSGFAKPVELSVTIADPAATEDFIAAARSTQLVS